jgi:hypothetical protein
VINDWRYVWLCVVLGPLTAEAGLSPFAWQWWAVTGGITLVYLMLPTPTPEPSDAER